MALLLAAGLRFYGIGDKWLWLDEAYSANFATLPLGELVAKLGREATPPLYYLLLRAWTTLFGSDAAAVRSLSAVCSLGAVAVTTGFATTHFSRRSAAAVCALMAVAPIHVYYAQEARMYALLSLLAAALLFLAGRALVRPSWATLVAAAAISLLALWTHNVAAWLVAGVNVGYLIACRDTSARVRWLGAQFVAALVYLPWMSVLLNQVGSQREVLAWFVEFWEAHGLADHLLDSFGSFVVGPFPAYIALADAVPAPRWIALAATALAAYGAFREFEVRALRVVLFALATAMGLSLGYSIAFQPVHIPARTDQAMLPLFVLLLGVGVATLRTRALRIGVIGALIIGSLAVLAGYYSNSDKDASRSWVEAVRAELRVGDRVLTTGLSYSEARYAFADVVGADAVSSFPKRIAGHPGYVNYAELRADRAGLSADAEAVAADSEEVVRGGGRIFLILMPPDDVNRAPIAALETSAGPPVELSGGAPYRLSLLGESVRVLRFGGE